MVGLFRLGGFVCGSLFVRKHVFLSNCFFFSSFLLGTNSEANFFCILITKPHILESIPKFWKKIDIFCHSRTPQNTKKLNTFFPRVDGILQSVDPLLRICQVLKLTGESFGFAVFLCAGERHIVRYCTALYCTYSTHVQCSTVQHSTVQYTRTVLCTAQHGARVGGTLYTTAYRTAQPGAFCCAVPGLQHSWATAPPPPPAPQRSAST